MDIGLVGLGKMGGNMRTRLREAGHTVVGYDRNPDVSDVDSLDAMVERLPSPKVVWVMVPAGDPTRETVKALADRLGEGDLVVDGEAITTGFNPQFLLDGLGAIDQAVVELAFTQAAKPVVISGAPGEDGNTSPFRYLLMPRRLLS